MKQCYFQLLSTCFPHGTQLGNKTDHKGTMCTLGRKAECYLKICQRCLSQLVVHMKKFCLNMQISALSTYNRKPFARSLQADLTRNELICKWYMLRWTGDQNATMADSNRIQPIVFSGWKFGNTHRNLAPVNRSFPQSADSCFLGGHLQPTFGSTWGYRRSRVFWYC